MRLGRELVGKPRLNNNNKDHAIMYQAVLYALYIMPFNSHNNPMEQVLFSSPISWGN